MGGWKARPLGREGRIDGGMVRGMDEGGGGVGFRGAHPTSHVEQEHPRSTSRSEADILCLESIKVPPHTCTLLQPICSSS